MEYFKTVDPNARQGLNQQYWKVVDTIWDKLKLAFPKTFESLKPCLDLIDGGITCSRFDILYGKVQSGKSRAMMLLCWYASFVKTGIMPVVLTIKLGCVRQDFQCKASKQGELNSIIRDTILQEFPALSAKLSLFQLQAVDFREYRKNRRPDMGKTLVLLQEPANLRELIRCYRDLDARWSMFVVIDEAHKMYTSPFRDRADGLDSSRVNNQSMMYWLHEKARQQKIYLLGVTATPHRATVDPHVNPQKLVILDPDPIPSRCYYGEFYDGRSNQFDLRPEYYRSKGLIPVYPSTDVLTTLVSIADRPHTVDSTGVHLVKSVLVVTDHYQSSHLKLRDAIQNSPQLDDRCVVWVVNSDPNVGGEMAEEFEHLSRRIKWGDDNLVRQLATGLLVIIGKGCFSAGVSVKPGPGVDISFKYAGNSYQLSALTDQIYRPSNRNGPKNLETNVQAMRLFGYYPHGCGPNLWINEDPQHGLSELRAMLRRDKATLLNQFRVNEQLCQHYRDGPASIASFTTRLPFELFNDAPYKRDARRDYKISWSGLTPDGHQLLSTTIYPVGQWLAESGAINRWHVDNLITLADFYGQRGHQNSLRSAVKREVNARYPDTITDKFQIPYNDTRYRDILQASVHPRPNVWPAMVKCFLSGVKASDTPLSEISLTVINNPIAEGDDRDQDDLCYTMEVTPGRWVTIHNYKADIEVYHHQHTDAINNKLPEAHYEMLDRMDRGLVEAMRSGKPPRNGYVLFMWWCRDTQGPMPLREYGQLWRDCNDQKFFNDGARKGWKLAEVKNMIEQRQQANQLDLDELVLSD